MNGYKGKMGVVVGVADPRMPCMDSCAVGLVVQMITRWLGGAAFTL